MQSNAGVWIVLHRQAILATGEKPEDAFVYFDNGCWQVPPPHPAVPALIHHLCSEGTTDSNTPILQQISEDEGERNEMIRKFVYYHRLLNERVEKIKITN